ERDVPLVGARAGDRAVAVTAAAGIGHDTRLQAEEARRAGANRDRQVLEAAGGAEVSERRLPGVEGGLPRPPPEPPRPGPSPVACTTTTSESSPRSSL